MKKQEKKNLQTKEVAELQELEDSLRKELFQLRLDKTLGKLDNTSSLFRKRKDLARVLTVLTQKNNTQKKEVVV